MPFEIDDLTILLALLLALLLYSLLSRPVPLVHPLLLGTQSEVSAVGKERVYRASATGQGTPLTVRPAGSLKTAQDIVKTPLSNEPGAAVRRCILDTSFTDEALSEILRLLPLGLRALFPSIRTSTPTSPTPILVLLPPSRTVALPFLLLALGTPSECPLVVLSSPLLLTRALTTSDHPNPALVVVHESLVEEVIEQMCEDLDESCGILVVGDFEQTQRPSVLAAKEKGMAAAWWEDVWEAGEMSEEEEMPPPGHADTHSYFYTETPTDPIIVKVTHLNITAGIAGILALFPADKRPSGAQHDVVASCAPLTTPFGLTVALASVYSGAGFRLIGRAEATWGEIVEDPVGELQALTDKADSQPRPIILFISCKHHRVLLEHLHSTIKYRPLVRFVVRQKADGLAAGYVSKGGAFDRFAFGLARELVLGGVAGQQLRAVVVVGDAPPADLLGMSHVLLGLPLIRLHPSAFSTGPIFVSHYYDIQSQTKWATMWHSMLSQLGDEVGQIGGKEGDVEEVKKAHVGPPASNVEVMLRGSGVERGEGRGKNKDGDGEMNRRESREGPLRGKVWARGPAVVRRLGVEEPDGWVDIGEEATVQMNGTFIVHGKTIKA